MADTNTTNERLSENFRRLIHNPEKIFIFSGKRKSGKDFITDQLHKRLGSDKSVIIKLSGPIKSHWAKTKNLDAVQLFSDGPYKEIYRLEMTQWGERVRNQDYGYFCRAAIEMYNGKSKSTWIVSDARRKTDLNWFKENYEGKCRTLRISSSEEVRKQRGWKFIKGIDDCETECNLDDLTDWDLQIQNNGENLELILDQILKL